MRLIDISICLLIVYAIIIRRQLDRIEEKIDVIRGLATTLPSAQPEIIRCKDCKYCEHWYANKGRCFLWHEGGIDVFEEGFCSYGERRTDE